MNSRMSVEAHTCSYVRASKHMVVFAGGAYVREVLMWEKSFTIPEIILIAGTRVALGAGLGLLIAGNLSSDVRKGAGWALFAVGVLSSIPLVVDVVSKPQLAENRAA